MASLDDVFTALDTLRWQHTKADDEEGADVSESGTEADPAWETLMAIAALVDAVIETAPEDVDVDERVIHRATLGVMGHGTGLWDDYKEEWDGHGKYWHGAIRNHPQVKACGWYSSCSTYVGDDGLLYIG